MLRAYANVFSYWTGWLFQLHERLQDAVERQGPNAPVGDDLSAEIRHELGVFAGHCELVDLGSSLEKVRRMERTITANQPVAEARVMVAELMERVADDLQSRSFLFVSLQLVPYYEQVQLFGSEVSDRLPSAISDIEEAGKCLALGRATACVFHLSRVLEAGLRALATSVGIDYKPSFDSYITHITKQVERDWKDKEPEWRYREAFFKAILGDLVAVKIAWRNPTMHVGKTYTPEQAEDIFRAVRAFSQRLATKLNEPSREEP